MEIWLLGPSQGLSPRGEMARCPRLDVCCTLVIPEEEEMNRGQELDEWQISAVFIVATKTT